MAVPPAVAWQTDHNLLFGVLALQSDLIDVPTFAEACSAWAMQKDMPLADLLVQRGWLTADDKVHVSYLLERKIKKHSGDVHASLAAVANPPVRQILAGLPDPDVQHSIADLSPAEVTVPPQTVAYQPGGRDRYSLRHLHARGGIGQVWLAHDDDVGRDVALKELLDSMRGRPGASERFLAEARITGQLEHPGIVPVYEVGRQSDTDQPYYTMRFIKGQTLREAVEEYHRQRSRGAAGRLRFRELLTAFVTVCNTVAFAHARGVVHRDLKGSNVVLGNYGEVIVLDWGLSKLLHTLGETSNLAACETVSPSMPPPVVLPAEQTPSQTVQGQIMGTPGYLAPEQAEGRIDAIDARTDVYGLGAVLYEILTGRAPFTGAMPDILCQVVSDPPPRPATLVAHVPPALEAVCLHALAKRREDRYQSATALADDVKRFLGDEPVRVYQEPWSARASRWARRHRVLVSNAAALLIMASVALAVGMVLLGQKHQEVLHERQAALDAETKAKQSAREAESAFHFLTHSFESLKPSTEGPVGDVISVRQWLDRSAKQVDTEFASWPTVEADLWHALGSTYFYLGHYNEAKRHLDRALKVRHEMLGDQQQKTIETAHNLAVTLQAMQQLPAAETLLHRALDGANAALGKDHSETLFIRNDLAGVLVDRGELAEAEREYRTVLADARRALGPDHDVTLTIVNDLAGLLQAKEEWADAEALYRECHAARRRVSGPDDPQTLSVVNNLASTLIPQGRLSEAEKMLRPCMESSRRIKGEEHPETIKVQNNLAVVLKRQQKYDEAELIYRTALQASTHRLTADHPQTLMIRFNLARVFQAQGKLADAESGMRQVLEARRRVLGPRNPDTERTMIELADLLQEAGKAAESVNLFQELAAMYPTNATYVARRTLALLAAGNLDGARASVSDALQRFAHANEPMVASALVPACLLVPVRTDQAAVLIQLAERVSGPARQNLRGASLYRAGRFAEAVEHLSTVSSTASQPVWSWLFLAMAQNRCGDIAKARETLAKAHEWIDARSHSPANKKGPAWEGWMQKAQVQSLYREAEQLIADKATH